MNKILSSILLVIICSVHAIGQDQTPNQNIPYSYQFYQKLNGVVYDVNAKSHSSIKGYYSDDSLFRPRYTALMNLGLDSLNTRTWVRRKLTQEHLISIIRPEYSVYADYLPDMQLGHDFSQNTGTWLNTKGYQIGATIGSKFSFYTNGFENQAVFNNYVTEFVQANRVVPGQGTGKLSDHMQDYANVSTLLSYTPNKYLNFALGYDKNFIGDGYRSMLLSDVASNYSFFRIRASLGSVQYQTIFAYMLDPGAPKLTDDRRLGDRGKWAAMHYLDWNISKRLSVGFFQAVTWADAEPEGKRGFDFNYVHPFVFIRPIESANTASPDKMRLGFNLKYELARNVALYGQFMFDEFTAKEVFAGTGYWANKSAVQLGVRGSDMFKVKDLNFLLEYNAARPYTYAHFDRVSNYGAMNQPLAHPFGANFRELVGILNYSYKRFDFQGQLLYSRYGLDPEGQNYGKNIFKSYNTRVQDYTNSIGQGIKTNLYFSEVKVSYLINPKYNLRLELGGIYRNESSAARQTTQSIVFGLRSSFRNIYQDF